MHVKLSISCISSNFRLFVWKKLHTCPMSLLFDCVTASKVVIQLASGRFSWMIGFMEQFVSVFYVKLLLIVQDCFSAFEL